jgi:creatinine amidohydrolase
MTDGANPTDPPRWGRYERLRPDQIEAVRAQAPVAYLPWGALEWHSYHNPIGLDGLQAHGQCCALARTTGGVVLPAVYAGTDTIKPFKGFPHSVEHGAATVRALCGEFLEGLADEGFRLVVVVTGHCGAAHVAALRAAVDAFTAAHPETAALLVPSFEPVQDRYPSNHAARGETSLQLLFDPDLVDPSRLPAGRAATLDEDGVWGEDPRRASAEEGAEILALFVERTPPLLYGLLSRHTP